MLSGSPPRTYWPVAFSHGRYRFSLVIPMSLTSLRQVSRSMPLRRQILEDSAPERRGTKFDQKEQRCAQAAWLIYVCDFYNIIAVSRI